MSGQVGAEQRRVTRGARAAWLLALLALPFLAGGVVVGDEAALLKIVHGLAASPLSFGPYARSADGWYIPHHILWFGLIYASVHVGYLLHMGPLLTEAFISCQTVAAGLSAIVLCHIFLLRRGVMPWSSAWIVLVFFAGGYGVFVFCLAGVVESYMALVIAARLFLAESALDSRRAWQLALLDVLLIALKPYSLVFLVATWPLLQANRRSMLVYAAAMAASLVVLAGLKFWLWNSIYNATISNVFLAGALSNFVQEFFSPWTGLFFCLPAIWVLVFFSPRTMWRSLLFKSIGICGCAAIFSLYGFFNGDIAGGRYIFPFVIAFLPEIAAASCRLLQALPGARWLLPVLVAAFLPVAGFGYPFPAKPLPSRGACEPDHPVVYSWKLAWAKFSGQPRVTVCFHNQALDMDTRDAASPHFGFWRVAYLLEGGHSRSYRTEIHDQVQKQHDIWGAQLAARLQGLGLGEPYLWWTIGLYPAMLMLWLSIVAARRLSLPVYGG